MVVRKLGLLLLPAVVRGDAGDDCALLLGTNEEGASGLQPGDAQPRRVSSNQAITACPQGHS